MGPDEKIITKAYIKIHEKNIFKRFLKWLFKKEKWEEIT